MWAKQNPRELLLQSNEESKPKVSWLAICCGCNIALSLIGASIAYVVFGIIFLIQDRGKGGECADAHQVKLIYTYCYMSMIVRSFVSLYFSQRRNALDEVENDLLESSAAQESIQKRKLTNSVVELIYWLSVSLTFAIYGSIVLFNPRPCHDFKKLGLYQWALVTFYLDTAVLGLICIIYPIIIFLVVRAAEEKDPILPIAYAQTNSVSNDAPTERFPSIASAQVATKERFLSITSAQTSVGTNSLLPGSDQDWSVCNHWQSSFHYFVFRTEQAARSHYNQVYGSKVLAQGNILIAHRSDSPLWRITISQYWNLRHEIDVINLYRVNVSTSLPVWTEWSVCIHDSDGFTFYPQVDEENARDYYKQVPYFRTKVLCEGRRVVEKWAMSSSWEQTIKQYWEAQIDLTVLKASL